MRKLLIVALLLLIVEPASAQNTLELFPAAGGANSYIRKAPTYVDARVLAANTSETHTVPSTARVVIFSADCNFYAKPGASAAIPAADVTDGTAAEQNPYSWELAGVTQITVIAAATCKLTLSFYK